MPRRTTTSYAILGLLSVRPWTTYELAKQVQRSLNWFWPRAERKLYDEPKNLVADGLATATAESTGKRPRTVYEITDLGRDALAGWLDEEPAPRSGEFEAMLKVFFGNAGTLDQLRTTLDRVAVEAQERLQALSGMAAGPVAFPERSHLNALSLRLYLEQEEAVLRWAVWAREQLGQWVSTTDPGTWDVQGELASQARRASEVAVRVS
jgi:DNA-binding PadR family transcriptional regulator